MVPSRSDGPARAPWTEAEVAALERWQNNPRLHALSCIDHSSIPMLVRSTHLLCDVPTCTYTQHWVPGVCLLGADHAAL